MRKINPTCAAILFAPFLISAALFVAALALDRGSPTDPRITSSVGSSPGSHYCPGMPAAKHIEENERPVSSSAQKAQINTAEATYVAAGLLGNRAPYPPDVTLQSLR